MKHIYFLLTSCLVLSASSSIAQTGADFQRNYEPIKSELQNWDPVRGAWLADNLPAVVNQQPVSVRNFPENLSPHQVLALVPRTTLDRINTSISSHQSDPVDGQFWTDMGNMVSNVGCVPTRGRSYGDPHLASYDGAKFSFQTVGEFVLTKSDDSKMEVQTRQKAVQEDFSLNTAVAMNVGGDRVCLYAEDHPDGNASTPVRLNGQAVHVGTKPYFLANGGIISKSGKSYIIDWPTGESVTARSGRTGGVSFYNVAVSVNTCTRSYSGVLGNANGSQRDDFDAPGVSAPGQFFPRGNTQMDRNIEKQRLAFIAKDFAEYHRITQATSLFDYGLGQSTFSFTDRSFPRVHRSINDLDADQRALARRHCEEGGIREANMEGCIYDNAYLNIPPVVEPPVREPLDPQTIEPVRNPVTNTNPVPPVRQPSTKPTRSPSSGSGTTPSPSNPTKGEIKDTKQPENNVQNNTPLPRPTPSTPTTRPSTPRPSPTTRPTPRPKPVYTPKPRPSRPAPRPTTRPKPTPKPRPSTPRPSTPRSSGRG